MLCNNCYAAWPPPMTGRASSLPYISGDTFRNYADHIYDETTTLFKVDDILPGDIVFVALTHLDKFFAKIFPAINSPFILLTHNGDVEAPGPYKTQLESDVIIKWFTQNPSIIHDKLVPIPIGLPNFHHDHGKTTLHKQGQVAAAKRVTRDKLLYSNINVNTYPFERKHVVRLFQKKSWCTTCLTPKSTLKYLIDLTHYKFCLSPRGNGLDCHRTWESLLMGSIPVVRTSILDSIYDDLPVLIVKRWEEITEQFLQDFYLKNQDWDPENHDKLYGAYWLDMIIQCKTEFLSKQNIHQGI